LSHDKGVPDVPKILYKYLKPCDAEVFLSRPQLRFTNFVNLDDILEVLPGERSLTQHEISKMAAEDSKETGQSVEKCRRRVVAHANGPWCGRALRDAFRKSPPELCISCLTELWESDGMWAIYADFHKGMVFGVNTDALPSQTKNWGNVKYLKNRPVLPTQGAAYKRTRLRPALLKAAFSKSRDWKYQKEWRATSDAEKIVVLDHSAVAEIIVGYEAAPKLIRQALAFKAVSATTRIYQAFPHPQKYVMTRAEIQAETAFLATVWQQSRSPLRSQNMASHEIGVLIKPIRDFPWRRIAARENQDLAG
jgi:hypothetical protein